MSDIMNAYYGSTREELRVSTDNFGTGCVKVFDELHPTWRGFQKARGRYPFRLAGTRSNEAESRARDRSVLERERIAFIETKTRLASLMTEYVHTLDNKHHLFCSGHA